MKVNSNYLKLKSAQVDKDLEDYTFFIEFKNSNNMNNFIKTAKRISKKNVHIYLFNRLGVYE
jgi:prephenate dehydratase